MRNAVDDLLALARAGGPGRLADKAQIHAIVEGRHYAPMSPADVARLALGLAQSGPLRDWRSHPRLGQRTTVDMPSTGGTSNKTPIIVPVLALACAPDEMAIPKVSTRGHTAGTIDILETVGYEASLTPGRYETILDDVGIANVLPSPDLAPADDTLMKIRRATNTMAVPALVVASILAKKIASGCRNVVIDLKVGQDSKTGNLGRSVEAARLFVSTGQVLREQGHLDGIWVVGTNTYRSQGRAFGRVASMWEAVRVITGREHGFLTDLSVELAARMVALARNTTAWEAQVEAVRSTLGAKATCLAERWLAAQGARTDFLDDPNVLLAGLRRHEIPFQHIGILSLEFHVDKLSRPLL